MEDCIFGRIDDIGDMFKKEVHEEFMFNCIRKAPGNFFPEYSYIYVLVAHGPSDLTVPPSEKRWSDILDEEANTFLKKHHAYVIAWMLMSPTHPVETHFIEYVESRVRGYNLADCMIKKFENEVAVIEEKNNNHVGCVQIRAKCVLPKQVTLQSSVYWCKYFRKRFEITDKEALRALVKNMHLESYVYWHYLENRLHEPVAVKHNLRYA